MPASALRLNMTSLNNDPAEEHRRYQAAIAMAQYADKHGFSVVNMEEHHCADNGWIASPLSFAAMIAASTEQIGICVCALLVTLYDPVRLAEDIAVIDIISKGRFNFIAGQGYREIEYHAMDKSWEHRGAAMDHVIETLQAAWTGEPFDYKGQTIRVSPKPFTEPHPLMLLGGMGKNAARRAARYSLPFYPPMQMPELEAFYYQELERLGNTGFLMAPPENATLILLDPEPEKAWAELGPYILRESQEYASWERQGVPRPGEKFMDSIEAVRAAGQYEIITPQECLGRFEQDADYLATLHPLVGGVPVDRAWKTMELYVDQVLAKLG